MKRLKLKVWLYDTTWRGVCHLSTLLLPYKKPGGASHRLVTGLFFTLLQTSERAGSDFIQELQNRRLRRLLRSAAKVPFWNEYFKKHDFNVSKVSSFVDLRPLPPTSKNDFLGVDRSKCIQGFPYESERILRHRTSGTTGIPFEWGIDKNVWLVEITSYFYRAISWYGGYQRFRWFMIAALIYRSYSVPSMEIYWNPTGPRAQEDFSVIIKQLREAMCTVLFSYPTNLLLFAKNYNRSQEFVSFKTIVTSGQRLEDEYRLYIEKRMGNRVATLYGAREFGQLGVECPGRKHSYHLNSERILVEVLDDQGNVVADGEEGLITITGLDNMAMPLIRYQLGDKGRIATTACRCGRNLPVIEFQGRDMGFVMLSSGERVPFRHLNSIILNKYFENFASYQVEQVDINTLVFKYRLSNTASQDFKKSLAEDFKNYTKEDMCIIYQEQEADVQGSGKKVSIFIPLKI